MLELQGEHFTKVLGIAFLVMFALYTVLGSFGYVVFGKDCAVLITSNMAAAASAPWQVCSNGFLLC